MDLSTEKLKTLIKGCIEGTPSMQKEFYYTFYPVMMRIGARYAPTTEDAEQWVHDGFIKVYNSLGQFAFQGSFEGWVKKVMTRVCLDNIRAANAKKNEIEQNTYFTLDTNPAANSIRVGNLVDDKFSAAEVLNILRKLPEKQRHVFNLYVFEEYSHKEIAQELDIKENHSHWLLHQAKKTLRSIINADAKIMI
ncbi:MAG TPA: sigma-70 family RNA polymerase sigma factor [Edaphocola sp.]|nr:sigma-70 family RNA polymerase sigma factor [Edaphocola sp.]